MSEISNRITPGLFKNKVIGRQGKLGEDACKIMASAIRAVDPYECIKANVKYNGQSLTIGQDMISTEDIDRVFVVGLGKASVLMAISVIDILDEKIHLAVVVTKSKKFQDFNNYGGKLKVYFGGHPVPTEQSINATKSILEYIPKLTSRDLVLVLISGGGSALFTSPVAGVSLDDFQEMTEILLKCGAEIKEINTLRKHLDEVKGGRFVLRLQPAQIFTLILSDVVGDRLDMIASGPTVPDPTNFKDALDIVKKYNLKEKLPQSIISYLENGGEGGAAETLKPDSTKNIILKNILIGSNYLSARAGYARARALGYRSSILSTYLTGETKNVAEFLDGIIKSEITHDIPLKKPACLILGGETTVEVTGSGLGGRNQDLALRMVETISGIPNLLFISLATDGEDGPTDAAGAAIDGLVFGDGAAEKGLDVSSNINNNDSYQYLDRTGALLRTGSSGTNVNDLIIILFGKV
jgi:hydroxypyruvate reductase